MNKNEILEELYATEYVDRYTRQICVNNEYVEDFIQEVWLIVCDLPEERLQKWYREGGINQIRRVVGGIINRTARSTTSGAYYKLVKKDIKNIQIKMDNDDTIKWDEENGYDI